jgi:epoxyqueuosine reductase QueG
MKKALFGIAALVVIIAGVNYAQNIIASNDTTASDEAAVISAQAKLQQAIQQRDARLDAKKARMTRVDTTSKVVTPAATTTIKR